MNIPRFFRFCCVGVANVAVDFAVYYIGSQYISIYPARALAWTTACLFSYWVNRRWTFQATDHGPLPLVRFGIVNLTSLGFGLVLLWVFSWMGASNVAAYLISLPFTTVSNYLGYSLWTFQHPASEKRHND